MGTLSPAIAPMRNAWREGQTPSLERRRKIVGLSALGLIDFAVISLYQSGIIRSLPDLPFKVFDSNSVNASTKAYASGLPDGTTGAMMYAATMMLATFGGTKKTGRKSVWDKLLMAAVTASSFAGAQYLYDMAFKQKKVCLYCVTGAVLNFSMLPYAWSEIKGR